MKPTSLYVVVLLLCTQSLGAQTPDAVRAYIDTALTIMQTHSLNASHLDWAAIRDSAYYIGREARDYKEAFPAIAYAFRQLKDYHGMVANEDTFYRYPPPVNFDEVLSEGIKKEFMKGNRIVTALLHNTVAYLRVPTMQVYGQEEMDNSGNRLRDSLCMLLEKNPEALILDLRMNNGGNAAPMISGLGPLFHSTLLGYGVDREGRFLEAVKLQDGVLTDEQGNRQVNIHHSCNVSKSMPVAVLIGPSTVSSAEILAVYLKQQPNVKLFGEPTPGFCNATEGFLFMDGQGYLLLSVNKIADADKNIYEDMVVRPDVYVKSADNYDELYADPTVRAALQWLKAGSEK